MISVLAISLMICFPAHVIADKGCDPMQQWMNIQGSLTAIHQSCIFAYDYHFAQRVAYIESNFSCDKPINLSGIFQMSEQQVLQVSGNLQLPLQQNINDILGVDVKKVSYKGGDLLNDTVAIVEFLSFFAIHGRIPMDIEGQGKLWAEYYRSDLSLASEFKQKVAEMPDYCKSRGSHSGDMVLIIDTSGSIGYDTFGNVTKFVNQLIESDQMSISRINYLFGIVTFSTVARTLVNIMDFTNKSQLQNYLRYHPIPYDAGNTNMSGGLRQAKIVFDHGRGQDHTSIFPKVAILITDGLPNVPYGNAAYNLTIEAANDLKNSNIELYTVGIGSNLDPNFLKSISTDCAHYFELDNYMVFGNSFAYELVSQACNFEARLDSNSSGVVESVIGQNESRFFAIDIDENSNFTLAISTSFGSCTVYISKTANPSQYNYDFKAVGTPTTIGLIVLTPDYLSPSVSHRSNSISIPIHIAVVGLEASNSFVMSYEMSDSATSSSAVPVITSTISSIPSTTAANSITTTELTSSVAKTTPLPTLQPEAICVHDCLKTVQRCVKCADSIYVCITFDQCPTIDAPQCEKCVLRAVSSCAGCTVSLIQCVVHCSTMKFLSPYLRNVKTSSAINN